MIVYMAMSLHIEVTGSFFTDTELVKSRDQSLRTTGVCRDQSLQLIGMINKVYIDKMLHIEVKTGSSFTETQLVMSVETSLFG